MKENAKDIQLLLKEKSEINARIAWLSYDGTPEVKENSSGKYLYIRKRVLGKLTSTYVDKYSDDLYQILLKSTKERRELNKKLRNIEKQLISLGYKVNDLSSAVSLNLDYAHANFKQNIYNQAILEGVATTFPQTETILDNGKVNGMSASDIEKVLNLKHAWEFILDKDVIQCPSDLNLLSHIAKLVNEGFYKYGGELRTLPVEIGGCSYIPPIPDRENITKNLNLILEEDVSIIDKAINLCLYCMKSQIFIDGNKRASVIYTNHYLISHGGGLLVIPHQLVGDFKKLLVDYYEGNDELNIKSFLKEKCWSKLNG